MSDELGVSSGPRMVEFDGRGIYSVDGAEDLMGACVEEGVYVRSVVYGVLGVQRIEAGPLVLECLRMDGRCVLNPRWLDSGDWKPGSVPFKAAIGVRPPIECEGLPGCERTAPPPDPWALAP